MFRPKRLPLRLAILLALASGALGGRLCADEPLVTVEQIQSARLVQRTKIVGCVTATLVDNTKRVAHLKHDADSWSESDRAALDTAMVEYDVQMKRLRHATKAADGAAYDAWNEARARLADTFAAYTAATEHLLSIAKAARPAATAASPGTFARSN